MDKLIVIPVTSDQSIAQMLSLANEIWKEYLDKHRTLTPTVVDDILTVFTAGQVRSKIKNGHYFIVQNIRKENIGYCGISLLNKFLYLDVIAVKAEHRGKRYGKRMLRVIEFVSRKQGYPFFLTTVKIKLKIKILKYN